MDNIQEFKEWVKNTVIYESKNYYDHLVKHHYLIYSPEFKSRPYYEAKASISNYLHLTGVSTSLSAIDFFKKAYSGSLILDDFSVARENQSYGQAAAVIRNKLKSLPNINNLFNKGTLVEEDYERLTFSCSFAVENKKTIIGYTNGSKCVPMSLIWGNLKNPVSSLIILETDSSSKKYNHLNVGTYLDLVVAYPTLRNYLSEELIDETSKVVPSILIFKELYNLFDTYPDYIEL